MVRPVRNDRVSYCAQAGVLSIASLLGPRFTVHDLCTVSGRSVTDLLPVLREVLDADLIGEHDETTLEFFDRIGYTRRVHDVHVLRTDSGWDWKAHAPGGAAGLQTQQGASDASW